MPDASNDQPDDSASRDYPDEALEAMPQSEETPADVTRTALGALQAMLARPHPEKENGESSTDTDDATPP